MNQELKVQPFSVEDVEQVVDILQDVSVFQVTHNKARESAKNLIGQSNAYACVVLQGSQVLGFGSLFTFDRVRGGRSAVIEDMVVAKDFRGKGIGRLVLKELLRHARAEGCFKVTLESSEAARGFYQTAGFKSGGQSMKLIF